MYFVVCYSTREKVVKCLQSNPVQVLLCVLVLLDAGIVIAQILLDLNSVRSKELNKIIYVSNFKAELLTFLLISMSGYIAMY